MYVCMYVCSVINSALNGGDSSSVDKVDPSGMSALHWACIRNQEVCARLLLDRGYVYVCMYVTTFEHMVVDH